MPGYIICKIITIQLHLELIASNLTDQIRITTNAQLRLWWRLTCEEIVTLLKSQEYNLSFCRQFYVIYKEKNQGISKDVLDCQDT